MHSIAMRRLDRIVRAVADKDVVLTLIGESGAGKEVMARRIHDLSSRRVGPFVPINCAAIPEALFESELFGHEKGAFTGASERAQGKIEMAAGGTLFLDEIGELPVGAQAKLLRFLENRKFMRVGGTAKIAVDVRLITATLRPLEDEVRAGRFRADLFYRIQGIPLVVPPLRERHADIGPLVRQLVSSAATRHNTTPPKITRQVMSALRAYGWPGNVRELRNTIELLCLLREGKTARLQDLPPAIGSTLPASRSEQQSTRSIEVGIDRPLQETIEQIFAAALEAEGGNRVRAAARLSVSVRTIQRYVSRTGIARPPSVKDVSQ
jgi:transcriptional regulator with PAS, ATPase and Fis domain